MTATQTPMKVVYYGSCQARAIATLLAGVLPGDVVLNYPLIKSGKPLPDVLFQADVVVYQPFRPTKEEHAAYHTDKLVEKIRRVNPKTKMVCVPFISFYGYWPDYTLDERNGRTICAALPYGMFPQQSKVFGQHGCSSKEEAMDLVERDDLYSEKEVFDRIESNLAKLKENDERCDVKIHDFIKQNYRSSPRMFFSVQHPANELLVYVAGQVLEVIHMDPKVLKNGGERKELLDDHHALILPTVQKMLFGRQVLTEFKLADGTLVDAKTYAGVYFESIIAS